MGRQIVNVTEIVRQKDLKELRTAIDTAQNEIKNLRHVLRQIGASDVILKQIAKNAAYIRETAPKLHRSISTWHDFKTKIQLYQGLLYNPDERIEGFSSGYVQMTAAQAKEVRKYNEAVDDLQAALDAYETLHPLAHIPESIMFGSEKP